MKIDWIEYNNKNHVLAWFLLEVMSKAGIERFGDFDSSELDVVLSVNGIEVDVKETFDMLQHQMETNLKDQVGEEYLQTMVNNFEEFVRIRNAL